MIELVLGGARSGKSRHAEMRAIHSGRKVTYLATATAGDDEMSERIRHHQRQRPSSWALVEEPVALAAVLRALDGPDQCILVDCLTLWGSNTLFNDDGTCWMRERDDLLLTLQTLTSHVILVSNEVGLGIVPMGAETRRFVDEMGRLHQAIATLAHRVTFVIAGLPQLLKGDA